MKWVFLGATGYCKALYHYVTVGRHLGEERFRYECGVMMFGLLFLLLLPSAMYVYVGWFGLAGALLLTFLIVLKIQKQTNRVLGPRESTAKS